MRIDYSEGLHKLNTGNKFNVQAKTGLNKQFILHNKIRRFVSILDGDDENVDKWKESPGFTELKTALAKATILNGNAGSGNYDTRNFALTPEEKEEALKESIEIQTALHKFLSANIDGSEASIKKLAKILKYDNFKHYPLKCIIPIYTDFFKGSLIVLTNETDITQEVKESFFRFSKGLFFIIKYYIDNGDYSEYKLF